MGRFPEREVDFVALFEDDFDEDLDGEENDDLMEELELPVDQDTSESLDDTHLEDDEIDREEEN